MSKSKSDPSPKGGAANAAVSPPRRLIVNADDFGLSPSVNAGVVEAHRRGILTSASLIANAPSFDEAAELARDNPALGVGLHLNLVRGAPLSPPERIPLLTDRSGSLIPFRWRRPTTDFLSQAEVEYRAQFEKILAAGLCPTHIDFEKHHAWRGELHDLACRLAEEYGVRAVRNLREPVAWAVAKMGWPGFGRFAMAAFLRAGVDLLGGKNTSLLRPDRLLGQTHIGGLDENAWLALLENLPAGTSEVMTHPGKKPAVGGAPGKMGRSWLTEARERELAALVSPKVAAAAENSGARFITFTGLNSAAFPIIR